MNLELSAREHAALVNAAQRAGLTPEEYAQRAISASIEARYVLPKKTGVVLSMQGKRGNREH